MRRTHTLQFFDFVINLFFYKKAVVVTWNIIKYNIFSSTGGPELYGTEPWTFYFKNLALNFNIWFILALLALPLFLIQKAVSPSGQGFQTGLRTIVFVAPFYMWLAIFTAQPHKEERFMYPRVSFSCAQRLHVATHSSVCHWQLGSKHAHGEDSCALEATGRQHRHLLVVGY